MKRKEEKQNKTVAKYLGKHLVRILQAKSKHFLWYECFQDHKYLSTTKNTWDNRQHWKDYKIAWNSIDMQSNPTVYDVYRNKELLHGTIPFILSNVLITGYIGEGQHHIVVYN